MKKFLSILLIATMILSMASLVGCGGTENTEETPKETTAVEETTQAEESVFPEALANMEANQISDITATGWEFSGGIVDGVEMDQDQANAVAAACGGIFKIIVVDDTSVQLINGEQVIEGTYTLEEDNYVINMIFPEHEYYGVLTTLGDLLVMVIAEPEVPGTALYMQQIDEY